MPTEKTDISPTYRQKGYEGKTKQARKRVISNRYRACFVNEYRKNPVNMDFYIKKSDTYSDTYCI